MSDEREYATGDARPTRRPMCRCAAVPQGEWATDLIAVETHPDLIELNTRMKWEG